LGQYFPGNTVIHKLDPRGKIILTVFLIIIVFLAADFWAYIILTVFLLTVVRLGRLNAARLLRSVRPLWPIILITLLVHTLSGPGEVIWRWFILSVTEEGLRLGLLTAARLIFLMLFSSVLTMTTSPLELTDGIERLLRPMRRIGVPAHELAMMMTIALRFIPTLLQETERIMMAQTARGADFKNGGLLKRGKNMLSLIVPLFLSSFRRADELATAMEARCYRGGEGRTRMYELALKERDACAAAVILLLALAVGGLKWYG
jgi:energy-coupling factor transport system permease protein